MANDTKRLSANVSTELVHRIEEAAHLLDTDFSSVVERVVAGYFEQNGDALLEEAVEQNEALKRLIQKRAKEMSKK